MVVALALAGCSKSADVRTTSAAPFPVSGARAFWATSEANDDDEGAALLLLGDEVGCDDATGGLVWWDLEETTLPGNGLVFALSTYGDEADDFTGLWLAGYGYGNGGERALYMVPYSDGWFYVSFGGYYGMLSDLWLRVDEVGAKVTGEFSSNAWAGTFSAEDCGEWDEERSPYGGSGS